MNGLSGRGYNAFGRLPIFSEGFDKSFVSAYFPG